MRYELNELQNWIASLRANDPVMPNDPRYMDLDNFEYQGQKVHIRSGDWAAPLLRGILSGKDPTCQVFSGFAGTGKSTELLKLKFELERRDYLVLLIDMAEYHDLLHPLTIEDMLIILAMAIEEEAGKHLGQTSSRFWEELQVLFRSELGLDEIKVGMKPLDFKVTLKSPNDLWHKIRQRLNTSLGRLREKCHDHIARNIMQLKAAHEDRQVVVIIDSLEKLSGNEFTFVETMIGVESVFSRHADHLRLSDCHIIYTIPPYTVLLNHSIGNLYDGGLIIPLPAVKVREKNDEVFEPGMAALERFVEKRIPVSKIFGEDRTGLRELLLSSGGHVRTVLKMIHDLLVQNLLDDFPVSIELVRGMIRKYAEHAARSIRPEGVALLESIRVGHDLDQVPEGQLHLLAKYMDHHLVLCYQNGEGWYQVHEFIRENVARRAAEAKRVSERAERSR